MRSTSRKKKQTPQSRSMMISFPTWIVLGLTLTSVIAQSTEVITTSDTASDIDLCPRFHEGNIPPFLSSCDSKINECISNNFVKQFDFCQACVAVDSTDLKDVNNCLCVQCGLKALVDDCFKDHCTDKSQLVTLNRLLDGFSTKRPKFNVAEMPTVENPPLGYFDSEDGTGKYRNLLSFERKSLVQTIVYLLQPIDETSTDVDAQFWWKKRNNRKHKDEEKDNSGDDPGIEEGFKPPLIYTTTDTYTTYIPKEKTYTTWKPKTIETTVIIDQCEGKRSVTTIADTLYITDYDTIYTTDYDVSTTTEYNTKYIKKLKTKYLHDYVTFTETDFDLITKTKYKHDFITTTETEIEPSTRIIKVGKTTKTVSVPATVTQTKTNTETKYKFKLKRKVKVTTSTTVKIESKTATITTIKTKKRWIPRTTTVTAVSLATTTVNGMPLVPMLSGIKFGLYDASENELGEQRSQPLEKRYPNEKVEPTMTEYMSLYATVTEPRSKKTYSFTDFYSTPQVVRNNDRNQTNFSIPPDSTSSASKLSSQLMVYTFFTVSLLSLSLMGMVIIPESHLQQTYDQPKSSLEVTNLNEEATKTTFHRLQENETNEEMAIILSVD